MTVNFGGQRTGVTEGVGVSVSVGVKVFDGAGVVGSIVGGIGVMVGVKVGSMSSSPGMAVASVRFGADRADTITKPETARRINARPKKKSTREFTRPLLIRNARGKMTIEG